MQPPRWEAGAAGAGKGALGAGARRGLLGPRARRGEWERARVFEEAAWRYEKRPWPMNEIIKCGLDDYMAFAFQAGDDSSPDGLEAYENGIQMYEHWVSNKPPSMSHSRTAGSNSKGLRRYAERAETGLACGLSDRP